MQHVATTPTADAASVSGTTNTRLTRTLLTGSLIAGPLYLGVSLIEAFTRPGFDITRHDCLLSNGEWGWIHITNLIASGLLVIAGAVGVRRALRAGRGSTWGRYCSASTGWA